MHCRVRDKRKVAPDFVLDMLRGYLKFDSDFDPVAVQSRQRRERDDLLADCRRRLRNPFKRWLFTFCVRAARRGLAQRENVKNDGVRMVALQRRAALEAGERLVQRGRLRQRDDIFFLRLKELRPALRVLANPNASEVAFAITLRRITKSRVLGNDYAHEESGNK